MFLILIRVIHQVELADSKAHIAFVKRFNNFYIHSCIIFLFVYSYKVREVSQMYSIMGSDSSCMNTNK